MSKTLIINLTQFEKFAAAMSKAPGIMLEELLTATLAGGENVRREAVENIGNIRPFPPVDTGAMGNSILVGDPVVTRAKVSRSVAVGVDYGVVVEKGRRAGKFPPVGALRSWVRRKGLARGKQADGLAYVIGRKISERPIPPKPFLAPAISSKTSRARFTTEISNAVNRAFERVMGASK